MINFSYKAIAIVLISAFFLSSCNLKETIFPKKNTATTDDAVNSWIYSEMKKYYLWESQLPAESATSKTLTSKPYFESLLYKPGEMDRFSWIEESSEELANSLAGKNTVLGVRTAAFFTDETKKNVALSVAYVLKNSPAERAGLKRGDFITEVGGVAITNDNFRTILSPENLSLTLGSYNNSTNTITSTTKKINVVKAEVQTIPVQMDTVITKGNKKIGYIHYAQFIPGIRKSNGSLGTEFDDQLRTIFANFKAKGVNELVLDLRYNGGGYISSAVVLASLIGKNVNSSKIAYVDEWNAAITAQEIKENGKDTFTKYFRTEPNNLGTLNRLYVLVSNGSASASELVINMLRPYMEVILIGDNTYGKNVGSISISDSKKRWNWGMQPIVLKTYNSKGESDYGTELGFEPTIKIIDNVLPFRPFATDTETLMMAAIEDITGQPVLAKARLRGVSKFTPLTRGSSSDNPRIDRNEMWVTDFPK